MGWFADPVPYFWGGLALAAIGVLLEYMRRR